MGKTKRRIKIDTSEKADKAITIAKKAIKLAKGEIKIITSLGTATTIPDGAGRFIELSNIGVGNTNLLREGNEITLKRVYMELMLKIAAVASSSQVRVLLVRDKQANGAVFNPNNLLQTVANFSGLIAPRNVNFMKRFSVLYDKVHVLNQNITGVVFSTRFVKSIKKQNIKIRYDGAVADITDVQTNSYSLVLISNEPTNEPTFDHFVRLDFTDK